MGCNNSKKIPPSTTLQHNTKKFLKYYEMGAKVGAGAFAHVRVCRHLATGAERVVKIIAKPYSWDDFAMEVSLLSAIGQGECPNVVSFYEYFEDKRFFYSVMEYCRGGDLFSYVASRSSLTTEDTLSEWMKQILTAINHIHTLGVVHRDVKPGNLLFADDEHSVLKMIDFGKVDIWAIGVLCYMLLFGSRPFVSNNDAELFREIVEIEPSFCSRNESSYDPSLLAKDFCRLLLLKDSRQRPTAAEALKHPWIVKLIKVKNFEARSQIPTNIFMLAHADTLAMEKKQRPMTHGNIMGMDSKLIYKSHSSRPRSRKQTRVNVKQYAELDEKINKLRRGDVFAPDWKDDNDEGAEGVVLISPSETRGRIFSHCSVTSGVVLSRETSKSREESDPSTKTMFPIVTIPASTASDLSIPSTVGNGDSTTTFTGPSSTEERVASGPVNTCKESASAPFSGASTRYELPSASETPLYRTQRTQESQTVQPQENVFTAKDDLENDLFNGGWVRMTSSSLRESKDGIVRFEI